VVCAIGSPAAARLLPEAARGGERTGAEVAGQLPEAEKPAGRTARARWAAPGPARRGPAPAQQAAPVPERRAARGRAPAQQAAPVPERRGPTAAQQAAPVPERRAARGPAPAKGVAARGPAPAKGVAARGREAAPGEWATRTRSSSSGPPDRRPRGRPTRPAGLRHCLRRWSRARGPRPGSPGLEPGPGQTPDRSSPRPQGSKPRVPRP
jgi:hypothetical protein